MGFEVMNTKHARHELQPGYVSFCSNTLLITHADLRMIGIEKDDSISLLADKFERSIAVRKCQFPEKPMRRNDSPDVAYINAKKALDFIGSTPADRPAFCEVEIVGELLVIRLAPDAVRHELDLRESA